MQIDSYFNDFLADIRLTPSQRSDLIKGHKTLRERLNNDETLKSVVVSTFLQGSYRRSTAVKPLNGKRADVDIIVVTNLKREDLTPHEAIDKFIPFVDKHYKGKYELQGRSIGIELSYVDLDIVVTSAPSEADKTALLSKSVTSDLMLEDFASNYEWRLSRSWDDPDPTRIHHLSESVRAEAEWQINPLWIPDRDAEEWVETHPLEQIRWTRDKNKKTSGHYINVVKALKWWRTLRLTDLKYPKGYPIEHMIGDCCPDGITSVAEGVCKTLEEIVSKYNWDRLISRVPVLPDRGVASHNVWKRVSADDFASFYDSVKVYAGTAREALDAESLKVQVEKWRELFGDKFPPFDGGDEGSKNSAGPSPTGGFTARRENSDVDTKRFA